MSYTTHPARPDRAVLAGELTSTLPVTLTGRLATSLDATGFQYQGSRFYDPAVGSYIQPSPFGGVLEAPQSLNRYALSVSGGTSLSTPSDPSRSIISHIDYWLSTTHTVTASTTS